MNDTTRTDEALTAQEFLDRHIPKTLEMAREGGEGATAEQITALLEPIYGDFDKLADKPGKRETLPGEDVFWWIVTILEELEESSGIEPKDAYMDMIRDQLKAMGERLEKREPLPPSYGIHWFDDDEFQGVEEAL